MSQSPPPAFDPSEPESNLPLNPSLENQRGSLTDSVSDPVGSTPAASTYRIEAELLNGPKSLIDEARLVPNWNGLQSVAVLAAGGVLLGSLLRNPWIGLPSVLIVLGITLKAMWNPLGYILITWIPRRYRQFIVPAVLLLIAGLGVVYLTSMSLPKYLGFGPVNWDAVGALAELFGALGQIMVAFLALYVAWRQYVISKELTMQQNRITQQQTIDAYFQGVSDLILDEEGLLEDWPPERAIAEGRTAAILTGLNAEGKAKVIRFLSSAKLLTPLKRDRRLGRPIFDGLGGYEEDIEYGVRVIDLSSMLAHADMATTDLRSTDLLDANLVNADLESCDLTRANLARSILYGANLAGADFSRVRLFYGTAEQAKPRDRIHPPNYSSGAYTGAVIENADLTDVKHLSEEQRYYCCAWGGDRTRNTIPGGCEGIPNKLL